MDRFLQLLPIWQSATCEAHGVIQKSVRVIKLFFLPVSPGHLSHFAVALSLEILLCSLLEQ
jgi:hypothetical protein